MNSLIAAALIYVPMISTDGEGNVTIDWPEVERCATQPLPQPDSKEWPEAWHQVYECTTILMARHAGYTEGQENAGKDDPYFHPDSWSPRYDRPDLPLMGIERK